MRGQYSLEFLVVLVASSLVFLAIAERSLDIGTSIKSGISERDSILSTTDLVNSINSICAMGPGSSISLDLAFPVPVKCRYSQGLECQVGNETFRYHLSCPVYGDLEFSNYTRVTLKKTRSRVFVSSKM